MANKKYEMNDLVNAIPEIMNDPLGALTNYLEFCETKENNNKEEVNSELEDIEKAQRELDLRKKELDRKNIKLRLKKAVDGLKNGETNYNMVYDLIEKI